MAGLVATQISGTITTGGVAQNLISETVYPANGYGVYNPDPSNDLWISESGTAAPNASGSIRVPANGGWYETPVGVDPVQTVSIYGTITGQPFTAKRW